MVEKTSTTSGMSRRRWISLAFIGGAGLATVPSLVSENPDQIIGHILRHHLEPANIPESTLASFLKMFHSTEHYYGLAKAYRATSALAFLYPTGLLHQLPILAKKIELIEELVVTHFTLSTNFFLSEKVRSGEEPVQFISYWRERPCNNPFATFDPV